MSKDIRNVIVDKLEEYCKAKGVKFLWSMERCPEGTLTINCRKDNQAFSQRISYAEIESVNCDISIVIETVIKKINELL